MRIDLPGIEAFLGVAERGSFGQAATDINLSQAALSHRVKKLEDGLGVALLSRTTRRVALTEAGQELLPVARRLVDEMKGTLAALRSRGPGGPERLAIGCLPTVASLHLPAALAEFGRLQPEVRVQIYDNSAAEIAARVRAGDASFGVSIVSAREGDLEITPLVRDPFVLVCPATHPLAGRPAVQWHEVTGETMIRISAEAANRVLIDNALHRRREAMRWRFEVQHVSTALGMVRAGLGLAVLPRFGLAAHGSHGLAGVSLRNPAVARPLGIVARRDAPLPPHAALLARLVGKQMRRPPSAPFQAPDQALDQATDQEAGRNGWTAP